MHNGMGGRQVSDTNRTRTRVVGDGGGVGGGGGIDAQRGGWQTGE